MALPIRAALRSAGRYLSRNPFTVVKMARHAVGMRVAIPLDAIRWFIANTPPSDRAPTDVTIGAESPAITVGATIEFMGTKLRASAAIFINELRIDPDEATVSIRLANVVMKVLGESNSPLAGLIRSGALDLSKPGNLVKFMPKKPAVLVEAHDDILVIDLMKNPAIARNEMVHRVLSMLTPVVNVHALKTDGDFLIVALRATPMGFPQAVNAARALYP